MTLDYYRIFYYVAQYQSFSKAAEILGNNQPNLSRCMNLLESELGCKLLVRTNRGVSLTPEGQRLFEHVAIANEQLMLGEQEILKDKSLESGLVTIGASETALRLFLLNKLELFHHNYPHELLQISNHSTPQAVSALKHGLVDLAVVTTPTGDSELITSREIYEIREIPVCGAAFQELSGRQISLSELAEYPLISLVKRTKTYEIYSEWFRENNCVFAPDIEAATADLILPMVRNSLGIGFVPQQFLDGFPQQDIILLDIKEEVPVRKICLLKRKNRPMSTAGREMERMILKNSP